MTIKEQIFQSRVEYALQRAVVFDIPKITIPLPDDNSLSERFLSDYMEELKERRFAPVIFEGCLIVVVMSVPYTQKPS